MRHVATNGLVKTSLIDMHDIDKASDSNTLFETCTAFSLREASLSWEIGCTFSSDNTILLLTCFTILNEVCKGKLYLGTTWHLPTQKLRRLSNMQQHVGSA